MFVDVIKDLKVMSNTGHRTPTYFFTYIVNSPVKYTQLKSFQKSEVRELHNLHIVWNLLRNISIVKHENESLESCVVL